MDTLQPSIGRSPLPLARLGLAHARRVSTAAVAATVITLAAVAPMAWLAWDGRDVETVSGEGLSAIVAGESLDLAELRAPAIDGLVVVDDELVGLTWALYAADGDLVAEGSATDGPRFTLGAQPAALAPGLYDLLVSGTNGDGATVQRAARFQVGD